MRRANIKFLVMDVDGTLTDGKIHMGNNGELFKTFDIKDGAGIHELLPMHDIEPVIITARESEILENRCRELKIKEVHQGVRGKLQELEGILKSKNCIVGENYSLENVAYIGDDLIDLQCMMPIKKAGGILGCPADAAKEVRDVCDFISRKDGGNGAVRDFIEWLVNDDEF